MDGFLRLLVCFVLELIDTDVTSIIFCSPLRSRHWKGSTVTGAWEQRLYAMGGFLWPDGSWYSFSADAFLCCQFACLCPFLNLL